MRRLSLGSAVLLSVAVLAALSAVGADDRPPGKRFAIAIEGGDVAAVRELLAEGVAADTRIDYGETWFTPLMSAALEGQKEIVELLLSSGADVKARSPNSGETPLSLAVSRNRLEVARLLIGKGAKLETRDKYGHTALVSAASAGEYEMARLLLASGADPNAADDFGYTGLKYAVSAGHGDVVRLLAAKGAKVDASSPKVNAGETALHMAIGKGRVDMVKLLLELKANPNARKTDGETPLSLARKGDQEDVVRLLKAAGAK